MSESSINKLLLEIAEAESEMKSLMEGLTEAEKRSLLNDMDDANYERWD